jgi:PIN like domain
MRAIRRKSVFHKPRLSYRCPAANCYKIGWYFLLVGMRNLLHGFYDATPAQFQESWGKAVFGLDANVLLNLYRYPRSGSSDLPGVLDKVKDRLWLPDQATMEMAEQPSKLDSQLKRDLPPVNTMLTSHSSTKLVATKVETVTPRGRAAPPVDGRP